MSAVRDESNGYDALAHVFLRARNQHIGSATVLNWSRLLEPGASILDVGCGFGEPVTKVLVEQGFDVYGVDASARMVEAFRARFPHVPIQCTSVEAMDFADGTFDAVVAWGLIFLLPAETQPLAIARIAQVLKPGGRLLLTASREPHRWHAGTTDLPSESLGEEAYERLIAANGLVLEGFDSDEGENFYFLARKLAAL
jgi:SAM-dependent methyltransferase